MTENEHTGHRKRMKARFCTADETGTVGSSFSEHELLELLLFYAQPRVNTNETAHRLIRQYGGLQGLMQAPLTSLTQVVGVGKDTALFLRLLASVYRMTMMPMVVLVHNHPAAGGPSEEDLRLTNELKTALEYAGVTLMEHFIFSENECYAVMRRKVYT